MTVTIHQNQSRSYSLPAGSTITIVASGQALIENFGAGDALISKNAVTGSYDIGPFLHSNSIRVTALSGNVEIGDAVIERRTIQEVVREKESNGVTTYSRLPGYVMIGDSTIAAANRFFTVTSLTSSGTTAEMTFTNHGLSVGGKFTIHNATQSEYNGYFTVKTRVSANVIQFDLPVAPSVSPATGSILLYSQNVWFDNNFVCMSSALAGNKGLYLGNYAMGGSQSSALDGHLDMALDSSKNLWARSVDYVFISTGINDVINDIAYATTTGNIRDVVNRIVAYGAIPVVCALFPLGSSHGSWTIARANNARAISKWIRDNVPVLGGIVIDAYSVCADLDSQYGNWKTNYSSDHIHPRKMAAFQVAKEIKRVLWDYIESTDDRTLTSVAVNPTLSGTGGSVSGTGASGDVADSFTITCSGGGSQLGVGSKGLSLNGSGESQRLAVTGAASADIIDFSGSNVYSSLAEGDKVVIKMRTRSDLDPTLTGLRHSYLQTTTVISSSTNALSAGAAFYNNDATQNLGEAWDLFLETPPVTVVSGMTSLLPSYHTRFNSAGGPINIDLSDFDVYKVT